MADEAVPSDRRGEALVKHLTGFDELAMLPEDEGVDVVFEDANFGGVWGDFEGGWGVAVVDCGQVDADRLAALAGGADSLTLIRVAFTFEEINGFRDQLAAELRNLPREVDPERSSAVLIDSTLTGRHIRVLVPDPKLLDDTFGSTLPPGVFEIEEGGIDDAVATVTGSGWSPTVVPALPISALDDLTSAAEAFDALGLDAAAGQGRAPVLIPPPALARGSVTFVTFANNPAEDLMAYVHVYDRDAPAPEEALSYLALHVSLATDTDRAYVTENASRAVQGHAAVVGGDSRATCGEVEEGGRNDTVLSWIDGDLALSISVQPLRECETTDYDIEDVIEWANSTVWCTVDDAAAVDCVELHDPTN